MNLSVCEIGTTLGLLVIGSSVMEFDRDPTTTTCIMQMLEQYRDNSKKLG